MRELDAAGRRLLAYLVAKLPGAIPNDPRTFVSYKQVHDELGLPVQGPYGASLKSQGLVSLAEWTLDSARPGITGLIVDRATREPGDGYFKLFGWKTNPYKRWEEEIARSKAFDWSPFVEVTAEGTTYAAAEEDLTPILSFGMANIWRLIAHHEDVDQATTEMVAREVLAVGWTAIGALDALSPTSATDISTAIGAAYPDIQNAHLGGPSLWNLYRELEVGDLVIVGGGNRRKAVMEVTGEYFFSKDEVAGYAHQRSATLTAIDPDELWRAVGGMADAGQNIRWTLARLTSNPSSKKVIYEEGTRFEIRSTAIERNPAARAACLAHYGLACFVCSFDFGRQFGPLGEGYIHVHHRNDLALSHGVHVIDPLKDLVPLCPNCHAMVHRAKPAIEVESLRELIANHAG